jgi:hypothetical protein
MFEQQMDDQRRTNCRLTPAARDNATILRQLKAQSQAG